MTRHLQSEELLRYLDGELSGFEMRRTAAHLRSCGSCQADLERMKERLVAVLDLQKTVFEATLPAPPNPWPRLEPRLDRAARAEFPTLRKRLFP